MERIKELFDLAVQRQTKEMNDNITGHGIDNHLMGLRYAAKEAGDPIPDIFADEAYAIVNHFALSTSQVSDQGRSSFHLRVIDPSLAPILRNSHKIRVFAEQICNNLCRQAISNTLNTLYDKSLRVATLFFSLSKIASRRRHEKFFPDVSRSNPFGMDAHVDERDLFPREKRKGIKTTL